MFIHVAHSQSFAVFAVFPLSHSVYVCPTTTRCFEFWLCDMHFCVCVPFEKQQKDNTIRRYGNKNIFFLQTEHRLMTMAAWAIKSRIFTSLKRALNFVETFFMEILHPTEISSNFLPHFSLWTKKWIFPLALIVAFYWVPFELLNLFGFALFNQPYLLTAIYELINYERKTVYMHCSVAFIENEFFVHILWAFIINGDAFLS